MQTYTVGKVAGMVGVSASSIRNWTDNPQIARFLSDMARREGDFEHAKQREYTLNDVYVLNTVNKSYLRTSTIEEFIIILERGELDTNLPTSSTLYMSDAESFQALTIARQKVEELEKRIEQLESDVGEKDRRIEELNREIGKWQARAEIYKDMLNDDE